MYYDHTWSFEDQILNRQEELEVYEDDPDSPYLDNSENLTLFDTIFNRKGGE